MSLFKRGSTWWIDFTTPGGERTRCSAHTKDKSQAKELHDRLKAEAWRVSKLDDRPERTWDETALKWLEETHEFLAHVLYALVALHVAGAIFTGWRHGENLVRAMFTGRKRAPQPEDVA